MTRSKKLKEVDAARRAVEVAEAAYKAEEEAREKAKERRKQLTKERREKKAAEKKEEAKKSALSKRLDQQYLTVDELTKDEVEILGMAITRAEQELTQFLRLDISPQFANRLKKSAQRQKLSPLELAIKLHKEKT